MPYLSSLLYSIKRFPLLLILLILGMLGAVWFLVPITVSQSILAPEGEGNRVFFGGEGVFLAQTFTPSVGLNEIVIPIGSDEEVAGPLILHIRHGLMSPDSRTAPLFKYEGGEAHFRFSPILRPPQTLFWVLEAPHSPKRTFWVYREQDSSAFAGQHAFVGGREIKGNFGFTLQVTLPRLFTLSRPTSSSEETTSFLQSIKPWEFMSLLVATIATLVLFGLYRFTSLRKYLPIGKSIWGIMIVVFVIHIWIGLRLPVVIDEGAYIQDVQQTSWELLPFRDFLTKGPVYLALLKLWGVFIPNTIIAWRAFSALAWSIAIYLLWRLALQFDLPLRAQWIIVIASALLPASLFLTTPLLLQVASVPVALCGLLLAMQGVLKKSSYFVAASAFVMAVAFLTRVSSVVPAAVGAMLIFLYSSSHRHRIQLLLTYIGSGFALFLLLFGLSVASIGIQKASILFNVEALTISQNRLERTQRAEVSSEPLIRELTIQSRVFWRGALPFMAALFLLPAMYVKRKSVISIILLVVIYIGMYEVWFHLHDTSYLLPGNFMLMRTTIITTVFLFPLLIALGALLHSEKSPQTKEFSKPIIISLVWIVLLIAAYGRWGRFLQNYLIEFIPPLALLVGIVFDRIYHITLQFRPQWLQWGILTLGIWLCFVSATQGFFVLQKYPYTGTIHQQSLSAIVQEIQAHVPVSTPLFTAQPVITSMSNRPIMFGYAHPGWYREARLGTIPYELLRVLFKDPEDITRYLNEEAQFVLLDHRTQEIYFDSYLERQEILKQKFSLVASVGNETSGDTFELYERIK